MPPSSKKVRIVPSEEAQGVQSVPSELVTFRDNPQPLHVRIAHAMAADIADYCVQHPDMALVLGERVCDALSSMPGGFFAFDLSQLIAQASLQRSRPSLRLLRAGGLRIAEQLAGSHPGDSEPG